MSDADRGDEVEGSQLLDGIVVDGCLQRNGDVDGKALVEAVSERGFRRQTAVEDRRHESHADDERTGGRGGAPPLAQRVQGRQSARDAPGAEHNVADPCDGRRNDLRGADDESADDEGSAQSPSQGPSLPGRGQSETVSRPRPRMMHVHPEICRGRLR